MSHEQDLPDGTEGSQTTGRYIHIAPKSHPLRGKLIENVKEGDPAGIKRTYTTKAIEGKPSVEKVVYEKPYSAITGTIDGLYLRKRTVDFGEGPKERHSAVLVLLVGDDRMLIEVEEESRFWSPFFMALPNVDINKKVRVETYDYDRKSDGDRKAGFVFKQAAIGTIPAGAEVDSKTNTYQVPWYWTKDNPGKLPPAESFKHPKTGDTEWFFDKRDAYLRETVIPAIADRIAKRHDKDMADLEAAGATVPDAASVIDDEPPFTALDVAARLAAEKADTGKDPYAHPAPIVNGDEDDLPF